MKINKDQKVICIDGKYYISLRALILTSKEKSLCNNQLYKSTDCNEDMIFITSREFTSGENFNKIPLNIFLCSDIPIKYGEKCWAYNPDSKYLKEYLTEFTELSKGVQYANGYGLPNWSKIIATDDNSLTIPLVDKNQFDSPYPLPKLSNSFVEKFTSIYNIHTDKSKIDILVECEYQLSDEEDEQQNLIPALYLKFDTNGCVITPEPIVVSTPIQDTEYEKENTYLGDGVYASFDGFQIWLATGHHKNNVVALEPAVIDNLFAYKQMLETKYKS